MLQTKLNKRKLLTLRIKKFAFTFNIFLTHEISFSRFINNQKYKINVKNLSFTHIN